MTDAELVNGNTILRVKDTSQDVGVGFILEAHYFLKDITYDFTAGLFGARAPGGCKGVPNPLNCTEFANGPFVAVEIGGGTKATTDAGPITGYALGWMIGLHHPVLDAKGKDTSTRVGILASGSASIPKLRFWVTVLCQTSRFRPGTPRFASRRRRAMA